MVKLNSLQVENFKCFKKTPKIEFGRMTLITGANSTGKSSLMNAILCLMQSTSSLMRLSLNGKYVELGNYEEMVLNHDTNLNIKLNFSLEKDEVVYDYKTTWKCDAKTNQPQLLELFCRSNYFHYQFRFKEDNQLSLNLSYNPTLSENAQEERQKMIDNFIKLASAEGTSQEDMGKVYDIINSWLAPFEAKNLSVKVDDDSLTIIGNNHASMVLSVVMNDASRVIDEYCASINFISSFRQPAKRSYLETSLKDGKIYSSGEGFVAELLKWHDSSDERFSRLIQILQNLGVLYSVNPTRQEGGNFIVKIQVHKNGVFANLSDVGFGVSQVLPIVIGDVELKNDSTLYAAQPEIHLHPSVQANLGDYFTEQLKLTQKNYVIETHSEYFLNRLRLQIVQKHLRQDEIRIYYLNQKKDVACIHEISFLTNGQIMGAPKDFFETYMMDVMNIAMEAV